MSKNSKIRFLVYGSLIGVFLFYFYGRFIWYPVYFKITGKKTLNDVYDSVGRDAEKIKFGRKKGIRSKTRNIG